MKTDEGGHGPQLHFAVLCEGRLLQLWQRRCIEELHALPAVVPVALLVDAPAPCGPVGLFRYLSRPKPGSPAGPAELPEHLMRLPVVEIRQQQYAAGSPELTSECAAAIRALRLDFILSFGAVSARALIGLATYGVWVFEFGDWERFRGVPVGFWEVYRNAPLSAAMLARLTSDPDVVIPLRRGRLRTREFSYARNRDQLLTRFTHWPAQVCKELLSDAPQCLQSEPLRSPATINTAPCNKGVLRFLLRVAWYLVSRGPRGWFQHDHWNIGIVEQPISDFINPQRERKPVKWLRAPPPGEFVADPFGVVRDGQLTVFCEHLSYRADAIGTIVAVQPFGTGKPVPVHIGPVPRVHLSYPTIFEHAGRLLCIPESSAAGEVALYGLERFPDEWVRLCTLVENAAIADPTVFRHGGLWWMEGALDPGATQLGSELHLWYATDLTGPWTPHPLNPVKTDVASARPAGTPFVSDGALYRPAQDSSAAYGSRVVINRVQLLTTTSFHEEPAAFVEPDSAYPDGLHTLSAVGEITLIDGKRLAFAPAEFRRMIGRMFMRRLRKLAYTVAPRPRASTSSNERHNSA